MENKYYWLKLKKDFFKRHDIKIIEAMPNGKDYILFYLKLLCESVDHDGNLRFSDQIPYNEDMLSVITNTNVDIVRSAIKIFTELNMMELMDDGTYYMNEVYKMTGSETAVAERVRKHRQIKAEKQQMLQCNTDVTKCNIEKDKDIDKDIEVKENIINNTKEKNLSFGTYNRIKLTQSQYDKLCKDYNKELIDKMINSLDEYVQSNNNKNKYKDFNLVIRKAIRENWFIDKKPKRDLDKELEEDEWLKGFNERTRQEEEQRQKELKSSGSAWLDGFKKRFE